MKTYTIRRIIHDIRVIWTRHYVRELIKHCITGQDIEEKIADAHNASLKKERERFLAEQSEANELSEMVQQLRTQLAESKATDQFSREIAEATSKENKQLRKQLAKAEEWASDRDKLKDQLAAAQATAKAHNDINGDICHIDLTDTSALDAAIAETQEPLVEALKWYAAACYPDGTGRPLTEYQRMAQNALANIEGK